MQKILLDEVGLAYICATAERFYAVSTVLSNMVAMLVDAPSPRLLKHIARCYLRLADNLRCAPPPSPMQTCTTSAPLPISPWVFVVHAFSGVFRAREALRQCLPDALRDGTFSHMRKGDPATAKWLQTLASHLALPAGSSGGATPGTDSLTAAPTSAGPALGGLGAPQPSMGHRHGMAAP